MGVMIARLLVVAVVLAVVRGSHASAEPLVRDSDAIWKGRPPVVCLMSEKCDRERLGDIVICEMRDIYDKCRHQQIRIRPAEPEVTPTWPMHRLGPI